jgi:asparagine synthase (glutamine-hydrolysing)
MCGLAGFIATSGALPISAWPSLLFKMGDAIRHRGPDDSGIWLDEIAGIGLVHQRLSILDLTSAGHQPMSSVDGRFVIVFNGEIYNHLDIRKELESSGFVSGWRGHSDTETLLSGIQFWGIEDTIKKCVGMFAIALWDKVDGTLTLIRDRLGEKPLYYGWQGETFLFGSELCALKAHPAFDADVDRGALALLMKFNAIPAPYSIYQNIYKLPPGSLLTVSINHRDEVPSYYWDVRQVIGNGIERPFLGSPFEAVEELERLLSNSVSQQMMSDVPLGAFLSGGIDSSTIAALMQAQSARPIRTFTIGFNEERYNEAEHAKAVARHLGTEHTELYVSAKQALDIIPLLPTLYCEPFADSSQIPTFLVSQLARKHVTVSLSGDGGDELFCGYNRYILGQRWWGILSKLPVSLRCVMADAITQVSPESWNGFFRAIQRLLPSQLSHKNIGDKLHKGAAVMSARTHLGFYNSLVSHWLDPSGLVIGSKELPSVLTDISRQPKTDNFVHQMMALDLLSFLPDDILTKVDRAAMGASLETRVPILDHRIVEFAWRLPLDYKIRNNVGKWPLRQVLYKYVPRELVERPKMGFGIPIDDWLRGPLRSWAEGLLDEERLQREGYFNPGIVRKMWVEHLSGKRNWMARLWNVLMFQAWLEKN